MGAQHGVGAGVQPSVGRMASALMKLMELGSTAGRRPPIRRVALLVAALVALLVPAAGASAADSLYWTNSNGETIRVGNLDGSGSPSSLFTGQNDPQGIAIDPSAGSIYWANGLPSPGEIRTGPLDGSGSPTTLFPGESGAFGIAIDPDAGSIYWAGAAVLRGSLDGSESPSQLFANAGAIAGIAIDPGAGKLYWADSNGGTKIGRAHV